MGKIESLRNSILVGICILMIAMTSIVFAESPQLLSAGTSGKVYVLSVGVNEYEYLPQLKASVNNARLMGAVFNTSANTGEVTVLIDKEASKNNILAVLQRYRSLIGSEDKLIFYYSGHGGQNTMYWQANHSNAGRYNWRDENVYDETIMPYDSTYDKKNQLTSTELSNILKEFSTNKVTIIVDNAYSLNNAQQGFASFQEAKVVRRPRLSIRDLNMYGYNILTGADWTETAWTGIFDGEIRGVFTHFLAQGIKSQAADSKKDGLFTVNEIYEYARSNTVQYIGIQHPQINRGRDPNMIVWEKH
jgi:uncharacterized caspase-like protein